jgi:hypothetical protein
MRNGSAPANGAMPPVETGADTNSGPSRLPSFGGGQAPTPVRGRDGLSASDPLDGDTDGPATASMPLVGSGSGTGPNPISGGTGNGNGTMADPAAVTIPPAAAQDQRLPIFDSLESDWFRRSGKTMATARGGAQSATATGTQTASTWTSPADEGWRAAQVVAAPAAGETTQAGLPKRVPRANLVPGSVGGGGQDADGSVSAAPARTADDVRARLSSFQRGVREGRAAAPQNEEQ